MSHAIEKGVFLIPTLSVITVSSHDLKRFKATRQSLIQLNENFEHVVVVPHNQMEDYYRIIAESGESSGILTQLIHDNGEGIYEAMNLGGTLATGKYLCFWNSGDLLFSKQNIESLAEDLNERSYDWGLFQARIDWHPDYRVGEADLKNFVGFKGGFISHQAIFVQKKIFAQVGGFETKYRVAADTHQIITLWRSFKFFLSQTKVVTVEQPNFAAQNYKLTRSEIRRIILNTYMGTERIFTFTRYLWRDFLMRLFASSRHFRKVRFKGRRGLRDQ